MRFPVVRERVRVQGEDGMFLVLSVDRERGLADLAPTVKGGQIKENVPLSSILPLAGQPGKEEPSKS